MIGSALLLLVAFQIQAPDSVEARLQRFADSIVAARPRLPGLLIFAKDGGSGRTWRIGSGWSDTAARIRVDPNQPLRIASNTKTYTAAAMLQAWEKIGPARLTVLSGSHVTLLAPDRVAALAHRLEALLV